MLTQTIKMILLSLLLLSCGSQQKSDNKKDKNESTSLSTSSKVETSVTLDGRPVYQTGKCQADVGCIKGFISHGMRLTIAPQESGSSSEQKGVEGHNVSNKTYEFNDAQDFGDRFDTAFLTPLIPEEKRNLYKFKVLPTVKRDNFASQFEIYAEGIEARDIRVKMKGDGNFVVGDMTAFDNATLRAVKIFRIEASKTSEPDSKDVVSKTVICLEIAAQVRDLKVEAGKSTQIGGLRNFTFHYTEDETLCANITDSSGSTDTPASKLPSVKPNIP